MLKIHLGKHFGIQFPCEICGKTFGSQPDMKKHKKIHDNSTNKSECKFCKKIIRNDIMKSHVRKIHENIKAKIKCEVCNKEMYKNNLGRHMKVHEDSWKKQPCEVCGKEVMMIEAHMRMIHSDEKSIYSCDICHQDFGIKRNMERHRRTVHIKKESQLKKEVHIFNCEICHIGFSNKRSLAYHKTSFHPKIKIEL